MGTARSTFVTRIQQQLADSTGGYYTAAELAQWVQDALNDLARETHYHRRMVQAGIVADQANYQIYPVTITATSEYLTPIQVHQVLVMTSAAATNYTAMAPLPWESYRHYMDGTETATAAGTSGTPTHYVIQGDYLYLYPTPNYDHATHGLRLYIIGSEYLTGDASESHLPLGFEDAVVWYAAWRGQMKAGDAGLATGYLGKYERLKGALASWVRSMRTGGPERIPYYTERRIAPR